MGLTQSELARRAGCAPVTVRKIERDALRPSVQLAELLALALAVPEEEQIAFVRLARQEKSPSPIPKPTPASGEIGLDDLSGRAVKGFQLAEQIGSGGFGVVYRAVQPSVQRDVAVKIILSHFANHPTFIRRFEAEAHLVARLEHPHIVPLYDYWREPNAAYLIMRLLRGGSLDRLLQKGPLPLDVFQRMGRQVGQALDAAHAHGVLHQDIKPANVLLDDGQNAYLADFGIAKNLAFADGGSLTDEGALISSPAYLSPEQIRDEPLRSSSDVYCFGLLLYEMLTGQKAFQGPTPVSLLQQHLHEPLPRLRDTTPGLPTALDDVLQRATAKQPQERYSNVEALLNDLNEALQTSVVEVAGLERGETAVSPLTAQEIATLENPYRGLRAFTEADAANFFGREAQVQDLLDMLSNGSDLERFAAVVGPSGSGKSSLVKAGLLPALRRGGLPGSDNWYIVDMTPGDNPWAEVEAALLRVGVNPPGDFFAQLQADNRGLLRAVRHCLPDDGETELLLLIDQFEELFTLVEDETVRAHFLQSLVTAVLEPNARLRVVITMRADFTDRPLQYVDFGELLRQRLSLVLPLTPDELTRATIRPVENLGMAMEPELVATIIRDVGDQPGMLPLLQYTLTEMFEQRSARTLTLADYRAASGVTGALSHRADEIYNSLDSAGQEAARQLFLRLITLGEGVEDTRRRVLLAELEALSVNGKQLSVNGNPITAHRSPITDYGKYRLLTFDHDPVTRGPTVEVAHEALLREWPRLREWLRESREDVRRQRLLAIAARQWQTNDQDDSYLLRGSRLTSFEAWMETTTVALIGDERAFLQISITTRDARHAAEEARQQRELETAQKLAGTLRQRALILAAGLIVVAVLAITAVLFARASNHNANLAAAREAEALESYSLSLAANVRQALAADDTELALLLALAANKIKNPPLTSWRTLIDVAYAPAARAQITFDETFPLSFDVMPDGKALLVGTENGELQLRDIETKEIIRTFAGHEGGVYSIAVSPDGRTALSGDSSGTAVLWDIESGAIIHKLTGHGHVVSAVAFLPGGSRAVTAVDSARAPADLTIGDLERGELISRFGATREENSEGIRSLALLQSGKLALVGLGSIAGTNPNPLVMWDLANEMIVQRLTMLNDLAINSVAVSPDEQVALLASSDNNVYSLDLTSFEIVRDMKGHTSLVESVAFSPDGKTAVSAGQDDVILWWDVATGRLLHRFFGHSDDIRQVAFLSHDQIISSSDDGSLRIWDLHSHWEMDRFRLDSSGELTFPNVCDSRCNATISMAMSPDGQSLLLSASDRSLISLDYGSGDYRYLLRNHDTGINAIDISRDGRYALIGLNDGTLLYWELPNDQHQELTGHAGSGAVLDVDLSEDGQFAVTASLDGQVFYWDLSEGRALQQMAGHILESVSVQFFPGEQTAVSGSVDGTMILWDLQSGEQIKRLTGFTGGAGTHLRPNQIEGIWGMAIAPDGRHLLSSGWDQTLLLWDLATGESIRRFGGATGYVYDVAILPNGQAALSTTQNRTLVMWDITEAVPIREYVVYDRASSQAGNLPPPILTVHPSGQTAVTMEENGPLIKWRLTDPAPDELMDWIQHNRLLRELTCLERQTYQIEPLCDNGVPLETTADLLTNVADATAAIKPTQTETQNQATAAPLTFEKPVIEPKMAVLGENRGELSRNQFDVWTFEMKVGERYSIEMIADKLMHDFLPLTAIDDRFETGALDTALYVIGPDGGQLTRAKGSSGENGKILTDTKLDLFIAPVDGIYRIEARSHLDDQAGGYTLILNKEESVTVDPQILAAYEGHYVEGPWKFDVIVHIEDGQLILYVEQMGEAFDQLPLSETEFYAQGDGSIAVFTRDESGQVDGYNLWVSTLQPAGGQWYRAEKLEE